METGQFFSRCVFAAGLLISATANLGAHPTDSLPHSKAKYVPPSEAIVLGQPPFQFKSDPSWGTGNSTTIGHSHALVQDREGKIYLANASREHCIIVYSPTGEELAKWGDFCIEAHGLAITRDAKTGTEQLYITDSNGHAIYRTTLDGKVLQRIGAPMASKLYESEEEFKPSKTLHLADGSFYVIDGYGKDYVHRYSADGVYQSSFGGDIGEGEAKLKKWGPHGGTVDRQRLDKEGRPTLLLALSDQQKLKRFTLDGEWLETIPMPGGNPRDIVFYKSVFLVPHLGDNWPADRSAPGVITVHDRKTYEVISSIGGTKASYLHAEHLFLHPHGIMIDREGDLYVGQYASGNYPPIKLERVNAASEKE